MIQSEILDSIAVLYQNGLDQYRDTMLAVGKLARKLLEEQMPNGVSHHTCVRDLTETVISTKIRAKKYSNNFERTTWVKLMSASAAIDLLLGENADLGKASLTSLRQFGKFVTRGGWRYMLIPQTEAAARELLLSVIAGDICPRDAHRKASDIRWKTEGVSCVDETKYHHCRTDSKGRGRRPEVNIHNTMQESARLSTPRDLADMCYDMVSANPQGELVAQLLLARLEKYRKPLRLAE